MRRDCDVYESERDRERDGEILRDMVGGTG